MLIRAHCFLAEREKVRWSGGDLQHWSAPRRRAVRRVLWIVHLALPVPASLLQGRRSRLGGDAAATSLCALECGHVGVAVSPARRRCLVTMEKVIKKKREKLERNGGAAGKREGTADSSSSSNGSVSCEVL